ncbi:PAS domain S-box protein [Roseobacter sp. YSTF-M11]|uniref:Sensor protein FixL n=1 Tax=Roseobacter insulae TaxID=2859783 RepID=A0A9X1K1M5_9RHOB|nr:chemotaxis protein CheB [Roseobacter insulae]MBW4709379.1 PAS domain S-box protein [Roseobacter insulae]
MAKKQKGSGPARTKASRKTVTDNSAAGAVGSQPFPIVGLGASAGGLEAYSDFFAAMPGDSGMAFVLIHHVDPDHESLMAELLAKHTDMPVALAVDGAQVAPNHVYIIPPNRFLGIDDGTLRLSEPMAPRGLRLPISHFLRTLAQSHGQSAVAIILSGTGSDGAAALAEIKEKGGIVLMQDPKDAMQDGMPRGAIAADAVDHILPVAEMPSFLLNYRRHPYVQQDPAADTLGDRAGGSLPDIISVLKAHSPIDFTLYKEGTLLRRIERRMVLRHMVNAVDYLALLKDSPEEAEKLCNDLLINVTRFFRDPEAFKYLAKTVLYDLVRAHDASQPLRIWVPACATGEEAYSLAMATVEHISALRKNVKLQVFASDVDERSLSVARAGVYSETIEADVTAARLDRFFVKEDHSYRVTSELRDCVVFANQNILADAPFSRLDLISCRNLLIYLTPDAQDRVISMFHFALNDGGFLLLGSSETVGGHDALFQPLSRRHHVYSRLGKGRHRPIDFPIAAQRSAGAGTARPRTGTVAETTRLADLSQRMLVQRYAPAAVLINAKFEVLYVEGPADQFLKVPPGEASQSVLAMARQGLRAKLAATIRTAQQTGKDTTAAGNVTRDGRRTPVTITAHPAPEDDANLLLVTFADQTPVTPETAKEETNTSASARKQIEQELEATRLDLQNTIRDFERSTEELKAANEEAMSMNEEFQSTNEELETSKEELQSLNEELTTLNTQLQQKVDDERRMADDLNNLLSSSGVATLFLDRELKIMRFTPATRELFNVISNDVGRHFGDITGKVDDPDLLSDARSVLDTLKPGETEVQGEAGSWFLRRILPYRTQDGKIDGVVITFSDVSDLKTLQHAIQMARRFAERVVNTVREPLLVLDSGLRVVSVSKSFHRIFGTSDAGVVGENLFRVQDGRWNIPDLRQLLERILPDQTTVEAFEVTADHEEAGPRHMVLNARKVEGDTDGDNLILLAIEDISDVTKAAQEVVDREARLRAILEAAPEAIITIDEQGTIGSFSPAAETIFGYPAAEIIGQNVNVLMPEPDRSNHDSYMTRYLKTGEKRIIGKGREMNALRKDGTIVPIRLLVSELRLEGERHFLGILHDLTDDKKHRDQLQRAQKMEAVGQLTGGLAHDFNNLLTVVIGNLELLDMRIKDEDHKQLLNEALEASSLGASLTGKLLSFAKSQSLAPESVALNTLVDTMRPLLKLTLSENIAIQTRLSKDLDQTLADPGQVESAILNMAINARDAMPDGGTLSLETRNIFLDEDYAATQIDVTSGPYVALSVTDTGNGMDAEVLDKVFEPFFSTKEPGRGSGLGLSMIYGFAKQSGGHVAIYSEVGRGTTVNLFLPSVRQSPDGAQNARQEELLAAKEETILVVEDEPMVRRLTATRLDQLGYKVLTASDGPEAIRTLKENDKIDLVLSDIVMPGGMTGFDVADQALSVNPGLKILLATGYAKGVETGNGNGSDQKHMILRKPYSLMNLSKALRSLLD